MPEIRDCIVLHGPDLVPHRCGRFAWENDTITALDLGAPCHQLDKGGQVIIPGLYNGHTHMGDSFLPDGATGLTLDLAARGMGLRSNRYSMLVKDGKVATLNVEGPGKFEVSDAETLLAQARG